MFAVLTSSTVYVSATTFFKRFVCSAGRISHFEKHIAVCSFPNMLLHCIRHLRRESLNVASLEVQTLHTVVFTSRTVSLCPRIECVLFIIAPVIQRSNDDQPAAVLSSSSNLAVGTANFSHSLFNVTYACCRQQQVYPAFVFIA